MGAIFNTNLRRFGSSTHKQNIAVNNVCRKVRCKVLGEDPATKEGNACTLDSELAKLKKEMHVHNGFKTVHRKVCMNEWDYEAVVIFGGLDDFKSWMNKKDAFDAFVEKVKEFS